MKLGLKRLMKRGQKGVTLIELMVVMGVLAVLASIIMPAVTGTKQLSQDSQVKQDATTTQAAVSDFNARVNLGELLTTTGVGSNGPAASASQVVSNKWPEKNVATQYTAFAGAGANVTRITLIDGSANETASAFVVSHNAINFTALEGVAGFNEPNGTETKTEGYYQYLWVVKKATVDGVANAGREVQVYSLTSVVRSGSSDTLTYIRIY